jgi:Na+-transporting NADH:ubiquinone oxidoreductase subunit NqrF
MSGNRCVHLPQIMCNSDSLSPVYQVTAKMDGGSTVPNCKCQLESGLGSAILKADGVHICSSNNLEGMAKSCAVLLQKLNLMRFLHSSSDQ